MLYQRSFAGGAKLVTAQCQEARNVYVPTEHLPVVQIPPSPGLHPDMGYTHFAQCALDGWQVVAATGAWVLLHLWR